MNNDHYLDRLVWDPETWVAEFNALLDALDVAFAIERELSAEVDALERDGLNPDDVL